VTNVRLSAEARADYSSIMDYLESAGGSNVAERYEAAFISAFDQIAAFPGCGAPRRKLGPNVRLLVINPYAIYYQGQPKDNAVLVMRILRGRRRVTRQLLGEGRRG
jgi:plasmid stabilization system protein ParE